VTRGGRPSLLPLEVGNMLRFVFSLKKKKHHITLFWSSYVFYGVGVGTMAKHRWTWCMEDMSNL
jgi:hypothetical protein